jgi:hypothetical protein
MKNKKILKHFSLLGLEMHQKDGEKEQGKSGNLQQLPSTIQVNFKKSLISFYAWILMLFSDSYQVEQSKILPYSAQWNADANVHNCGWNYNCSNELMGCSMSYLHDSVQGEGPQNAINCNTTDERYSSISKKSAECNNSTTGTMGLRELRRGKSVDRSISMERGGIFKPNFAQ